MGETESERIQLSLICKSDQLECVGILLTPILKKQGFGMCIGFVLCHKKDQ